MIFQAFSLTTLQSASQIRGTDAASDGDFYQFITIVPPIPMSASLNYDRQYWKQQDALMRIQLNCRGQGLHGCFGLKKTMCDEWVEVDETGG